MSVQYRLCCPYCGFTLKTTHSLSRHGGKLLGTCPMCGETYSDPYGSEIALEPYKQPDTLLSLLKSSFYISIALSVLLAFSAALVTYDDPVFLPILAVSFPSLWLLFALYSLLTRKKSRNKYISALRESERRLSDSNYALALKHTGYYVPLRFLPPDASDVEPDQPARPLRVTYSTAKTDLP